MKLNTKRVIFVGLAFMSISAFWQIYDNALPLILENNFNLSSGITGFIMGIDNILALFMLPLFGALSDKTNTKLGRRMPYIVGGTIVAVICTVLIPIAQQWSLALFMVIIMILLIAMSTYRSPAVALMPDVTIKPLRSKANAVINLMGAIGGAAMLGITPILVSADSDNYFPLFLVLAIFMAVCVAVLVFTINEPTSVAEMRSLSEEYGIDEESENEEQGSTEKMAPAVKKSFGLILSSIFLWFMGYNAVTTGFTRYAENVWGKGLGNVSMILLVAQVAAIISFIPVGMIASKIGRKKTILCGITMLAIAFGSSIMFTSFSYFMFVFFALAGIGWAFINVNSYPMVVEMSKGSNIGKYTGYYYFFSMAAQSVTPAFSGFLVDKLDNWRILFPYGCVFVALSFVTMLFVKHGDSRPELPKDKLEAFDVDD
ncbi:MAG: MFS transporter [Oscillospiraceae bacterium]|nr:MFS transporter [Oscillospiraceae bacterium]